MSPTAQLSRPLERLLTQAWQRRGPLAWLLLPFALIFGAMVTGRRLAYQHGLFTVWTAPVPVIVVGNVFVGGTGKTPLVIWLVEQLRAMGYVPGVISRGYGRHSEQVRGVTVDSTAEEAGDEPLLIAQTSRVPVFVGRDRVAAARALLAAYPQVTVIVSDDGLQHYALGRTIEIQLSDLRGHGNGWLLPAGPLREPASRRSDFYVINGASDAAPPSYAMQVTGGFAVSLADGHQRIPLSSLKNRRVAAVAGMGNPARFFQLLHMQGVQVDITRALPDHFDYSENPFVDMPAEVILITEKDAVKCERAEDIARDTRLWKVPVQASIAGPLAERIVEKLRG